MVLRLYKKQADLHYTMYNKIFIIFILFVFPISSSSQSSQSIIVPNKLYFEDICELLDTGNQVEMIVKGKSMCPIIGDCDVVVIQKRDSVRLFDIVLAEISPEKYVLHRVIDIRGNCITLMGDANLISTETCKREDVKATAIYLTSDGKRYALGKTLEKKWAKKWKESLFVRDSLLLITKQKQLRNEVLCLQQVVNQHINRFEQNKRFKISDSVKRSRINNNLFWVKTNNTYTTISLNSSALFLFEKMMGREFTLEDMTKAILEEYDVTYSIAYNDCMSLLKEWYSKLFIKQAS